MGGNDMNLINSDWISYKGKNVKIKKNNGKLTIENKDSSQALVVCTKIMKKNDFDIKVKFEGKITSGEAAVLLFLNRKREILAETSINSEMMIVNEMFKYYIAVLKIHGNTTVEISNIELENKQKIENQIYDDFNNDILIITPSYPSEEHKYLSGFVHSRVKVYQKNGIKADIAVVYDYKNICKYEFEGVKATRMLYSNLRSLLLKKKYKKILIHFFDENYFNVLEGCNLDETEIYVWVHGPETLYWDYPKFTTKYFEKENEISEEMRKKFTKVDKIIKKYNERKNVKWIFVSDWIKNQSEKLLNIKFNNYEVIPNIIDTELFDYQEKDEKQMKKIFVLRRYDNINKYAVDISVRAILELSKRDIFKELEFNIYGSGECYNELLSPLMKFNNINFYKGFFTHSDISMIHKENGIALFPTRYDAQGVSMCEAGSSGLLVISSENDAIKEFIPYEDGNIIDTEDYKAYADFIEKIVKEPKLFKKITKDTVKKIKKKCSYDATVKKEIELIKKENNLKEDLKSVESVERPILTIIIPAYNVAQFITKTLFSLLKNNKNSKYLEILVVNDGSKDNTKEIVNKFIKDYCDTKKPIVKLIDKENGGHGSTINVGIENARGKYTRIIDGDDWVKTEDLEKLIDILKQEETDIVVTNYCEDRFFNNSCQLISKRIYDFMIPGYSYTFDELCIENYGFKNWGPILATSNIKTQKLKDANFKLSEKCFYVDMEFNSFYLPVIKDIVYYDLDIYRYFIGRPNQSISLRSFVRNIGHHEKVIKNILVFINNTEISEGKKKYINSYILEPMILAHYNLLLDTIRSRKKFVSFDNMLKENLSSDKYKQIGGRVKLLRKTRGLFIKTLFYLSIFKRK